MEAAKSQNCYVWCVDTNDLESCLVTVWAIDVDDVICEGGGRWDFRFCGFGYFLARLFDFCVKKISVSWFWCSLRFVDISFFAWNTNRFSDLISDAVFGFSYLTYLSSGFSSIWAAITRLYWSRIAAKRTCYRKECVKNQLKGGGGEGTATGRVRLSTEYRQGFFINATSKLVTKLQATRDWLIQHSNRISKLSGLSSRMETLD